MPLDSRSRGSQPVKSEKVMRNVIVKAGVVEVDVMPLDHVLVTIPKSLDTNDQYIVIFLEQLRRPLCRCCTLGLEGHDAGILDRQMDLVRRSHDFV